jgi:hypothetical protein
MVNGWYGIEAQEKVSIYEVTYSTRSTSKDKLSYSDVILVEAETHEELYTKVVDTLLRTLGPSGNYYVDSIGDNPYEPRPKKRIAKKTTKDYKVIVRAINALISKRNQGP